MFAAQKQSPVVFGRSENQQKKWTPKKRKKIILITLASITGPFLQRKLNENSNYEKKQLKSLLQVNCVSLC